MKSANASIVRLSANAKNSPLADNERTRHDNEHFEKWHSRLDDAKRVVATQIMKSIKSKWDTATALEAETGICQTEISRIRHEKFDRFSLERLVRLLCQIDPEVEVELQLKIAPKKSTD